MKLALIKQQIIFVVLFSTNAFCQTCITERIIDKSIASASTFANYWERDGSVTAESRRMVAAADTLLNRKINQTGKVNFIFELKPSKSLSDYEDFPACEAKFQTTKQSPLKYGAFKFSSVDAVINWFGDFSKGSGENGKDLYKKCDGKCSPVYKLTISKQDNQLQVQAEVICGHARDKDDNTYQLSLKENKNC